MDSFAAQLQQALEDADEDAVFPLETLVCDYMAIIGLIEMSVTKLAICLKPPVTEAHLPTALTEVVQQTNRLRTCTTYFAPSKHGRTLNSRVAALTRAILATLPPLLHTLEDADNQAYLHRAGAVYDALGCAKRDVQELVPEGNLGLVKRCWSKNHAIMEDALDELKGIIADQNSGDDETGWEELDASRGEPITTEEIQSCQRAQLFLRLAVLFHKRGSTQYLTSSADNTRIDKLIDLSSVLIAQTDDFVSAFYPPHDPSELKSCVSEIIQSISAIAQTCRASEEDEKWYRTFLQQHDRARDVLLEGLGTD